MDKKSFEDKAVVELANQFWTMCTIYLMKLHISKEGKGIGEELISFWRERIGEQVEKEIHSHEKLEQSVFMKVMKDAGYPMPKTSEVHEQVDGMLYDSEKLIRELLELTPYSEDPPEDIGNPEDDIPF